MMEIAFSLDVLNIDSCNSMDDNVDVVVTLKSGRRFAATFFTLANIESLMKKWSREEECLAGSYFWAESPIIIRHITYENIYNTVKDLVDSGEIFDAFTEI